jgi:hypothetical protein
VPSRPVNHLSSADWKQEARVATVMSLFDDVNGEITRASIAAATGLGVADVVKLEETMVKRGFIRGTGREKFERAAALAELDHNRFDRAPRLEPQTAREALLEIRRVAAEVHLDTDAGDLGCQVDRVALEGLHKGGPINFEWPDQLADRLAPALKILSELRAGTDVATLSGEIDEVLTLPPDIETVVERRVGRVS